MCVFSYARNDVLLLYLTMAASGNVVWKGCSPGSLGTSLPVASRGEDKRQQEITDAGTTVPLSPHLQCPYSDKQYSLYSTKYSDRSGQARSPIKLNWLIGPKLVQTFFKYFHGINIYDIVRQTIPSVYYSWSEGIFAKRDFSSKSPTDRQNPNIYKPTNTVTVVGYGKSYRHRVTISQTLLSITKNIMFKIQACN